MKAMLLRVGIDKGSGGCLAPIFQDGSFEYIPIPETEETKEIKTFKNTQGVKNKPFAAYIPEKIHELPIHFDPEFETFTYGDATSKRKSLLKLDENDLLVFYAGLEPYMNNKFSSALYIIGYFKVKEIIDFNKLETQEIIQYSKKYSNNAHIKRINGFENLVIIAGDKKSKILDKAILISEPKLNKLGRPYHAVSPVMEKLLGIKGSIQRSIPPRFIEDPSYLENLNKLLNL
ncbi:MAG: hypothetical protein LLF83_10280 [Methanobacterium sp.]|nr:hypothetical protein [Methanobacterium sp.]